MKKFYIEKWEVKDGIFFKLFVRKPKKRWWHLKRNWQLVGSFSTEEKAEDAMKQMCFPIIKKTEYYDHRGFQYYADY